MTLSEQQILEKIARHQLDFQDAEGNNLLHLLLRQEAYQHLSVDSVKDLLKQKSS